MSWRKIKADTKVAGCLGLKVGAPIVDLYRVRTSDETPVTIEHDYFSADLVPPGPITMGPSLYSFLSDICGAEVVFGVADLEPHERDPSTAQSSESTLTSCAWSSGKPITRRRSNRFLTRSSTTWRAPLIFS